MKVLYLTYDGLTDPLGQSQIIPYLLGLSKVGHQISIVSFEKNDSLESTNAIKEMLQDAKIEWHPLNYTQKPAVLSTIYDIYRLNRDARKLHDQEDFQIVHCRSYITALIGLRLKRKFGLKFLFDMRGFWADERVEGGIWNMSNPLFKVIYKFFKDKEKQFFAESDAIVSLTHAGKDIIQNQLLSGSDVSIQVIPCCVDNSHFDPTIDIDSSSLKKSLNIDPDAFVLGYIGSIGTWYMLSEMIDFYKALLKSRPNAYFLFVTRENPKTIMDSFINRKCDTNRVLITSSNRNDVPRYLSILDWSIFFIKPVFSKQASSPTKQGEIMSMGIPVVCNKHIGDTDLIIKEYNSGISVDEFSRKEYEKAILGMTQFQINTTEIRAGSIDYFGLEEGIRRYSKIYEQLG